MSAPTPDASTPAPSSGGGGTLPNQVEIEELRKVGVSIEDLEAHLTASRNKVVSASVPLSMFNGYPPAAAFAQHHKIVLDVIGETLTAMGQDVATFGNIIVSSADAYEQADTDLATTFASVASGLSGQQQGESAGNAWDDTVNQNADPLNELDTQMTGDEAQQSGATEGSVDMLGGSSEGSGEESSTSPDGTSFG